MNWNISGMKKTFNEMKWNISGRKTCNELKYFRYENMQIMKSKKMDEKLKNNNN